MQKPTYARTALIALPVAGALLLAGCSGDSMPGALNSATPIGPTNASSPTTSVPTPTAPKTQDPNSDAALIAAVLAYIKAADEASASMKTDELRNMFAKGCIRCEQEVAKVDSWAKSGYAVVGGQAHWSEPTISSRNERMATTLVRVLVSVEAGMVKDAAGKSVEKLYAGPKKPIYFMVRTIKGRALVTGITS